LHLTDQRRSFRCSSASLRIVSVS